MGFSDRPPSRLVVILPKWLLGGASLVNFAISAQPPFIASSPISPAFFSEGALTRGAKGHATLLVSQRLGPRVTDSSTIEAGGFV
jgi:hypothetical protein